MHPKLTTPVVYAAQHVHTVLQHGYGMKYCAVALSHSKHR